METLIGLLVIVLVFLVVIFAPSFPTRRSKVRTPLSNPTNNALDGIIVGFLCADPDSIDTFNLRDHLAAFVFSCFNEGSKYNQPPIEETVVVIESNTTALRHKRPGSYACFKCNVEDIGQLMMDESDGVKASIILFVGSPEFLQEVARQGFNQPIETLKHLQPGKIFIINPTHEEHPFQRWDMSPILMHYFHHGQNLEGVEAARVTLPLREELEPIPFDNWGKFKN